MPDRVQVPTAIRMNQASKQGPWILSDKLPLPISELDLSQVLHPLPVLREETWPRLGVGMDFVRLLLPAMKDTHLAGRHDLLHGHDALTGDPWIGAIHRDC
jgi:hypothetical protein